MTEAPAPPAADQILSPDYIKLWFGMMFFMLSLSSFNLLPYYLELRGASPDLYAAVAGSMGITNFLGMVLLGHRADVWSRKTTVVFYFQAALAGNLLALWAMSQPSPYWYFLVRMLQGVFMGLGFPLVFTWALEIAPPLLRPVALAWFGIAGITANSLGPTLGELALSLQPDPSRPSAYFAVFAMAVAFQLVSLVFLLTTRDVRAEAPREGEGRKGLAPLLRRGESVLVLLVACGFGGMFGVVMSFGKNYTASLRLDYVSVLLWAYSIGAILSRVFYRKITRYLADPQMISLGLVGIGVSYLLLGGAGAYPLLALAGLVYGLSHGILYPTMFMRFLSFQQRDEVGRAATLYQGLFSVGWGLVPMSSGPLVRLANFPTLFSLLAVLAGIAVILHLFAERIAAERAGKERAARDDEVTGGVAAAGNRAPDGSRPSAPANGE